MRAVAATLPEMRRTAPTIPPVPAPVEEAPSILGFPAEVAEDDADEEEPPGPVTVTRAASTGRLVVVRRADGIGGLLLVLAGVAAALSLWFPWVAGAEDTGLSLVRRGIEALLAEVPDLARTALWQPLAVVLGGGLLFLLGLLLFIPARTHRFVGLLAFVAAETAAAGILTSFADTGWRVVGFDVGIWFAVAVPVLGGLGALKGMLTSPRLLPEVAEPRTTEPPTRA